MKRSNHVILTTLFLAAVSSYAAKGQDVNVSARQDDSTGSHHSYGGGHSGGHFFSFLHHSHQINTSTPPTSVPRKTGGFGMSLRTSASAHS